MKKPKPHNGHNGAVPMKYRPKRKNHVANHRIGEVEFHLHPQHPKPGSDTVNMLLGTPSLGTVRCEWFNAMIGLPSPPNWSLVRSVPQGYLVPDAQNMLVDTLLRGNFRALLLIEDDTIPPPNALLQFDKWLWKMERKKAPPIVSGLYHIKGSQEVRKGKTGGIELLGPEPLAYRGGGQRAYRDWTPGDVIWVSGIPTGALLIHRSVLEAWANEPDIETYSLQGYPWPLKKIFQNPALVWVDPHTHGIHATTGTSDLWFSEHTIKRDILTKAGWPAKFAKKQFPYIIDTSLRFMHIDRSTGQQW